MGALVGRNVPTQWRKGPQPDVLGVRLSIEVVMATFLSLKCLMLFYIRTQILIEGSIIVVCLCVCGVLNAVSVTVH